MNKIHEDLCPHRFSVNFCPHGCVRVLYHEDLIREKRRNLLRMFTKREWNRVMKNPVTKESVIKKFQQLHLLEHYTTLPKNIIININTPWQRKTSLLESLGLIPTPKRLNIGQKDHVSHLVS